VSVQTLPRPAVPDGSSSDDPFDHIYCCDPDVALCGADVSGEVDVGDAELEAPCPMCGLLEDLEGPCGADGCPGEVRS
jgi:hypothetical protein